MYYTIFYIKNQAPDIIIPLISKICYECVKPVCVILKFGSLFYADNFPFLGLFNKLPVEDSETLFEGFLCDKIEPFPE